MFGFRHGVNHGEEALGEFVELTLTWLICFYRHPRVVTTFRLGGDCELAKGTGKAATPRCFLDRRHPSREELGGPSDDLCRRDAGPVEIFHPMAAKGLTAHSFPYS